MILGDILRRNAAQHADKPAVICEGRTTTHAQLLDRSLRLADGLRNGGLRKQDRIAILAQNSTEYLELYGACEEAGFIAVGLNYRLSEPELVDILRDAAPSVIFFDSEYAKRIDVIEEGIGRKLRRIELGGDPEPPIAYERLIAGSSPVDGPRASDHDTVCIFYTSGTTGRPKGAMLPNGGQAAQAEIYAKGVKAQASDRMLIVMPLFHCGGKNLEMMYRSQGAAIVLHRAFDAQRIVDSFRNDGVTAAHLAPIMVHQIIDLLDAKPESFPKVHTIHYASAPNGTTLRKKPFQST